MLQGFGIMKSFEGKQSDESAPKSIHKFEKNELHPVIYYGNLTVSFQTKYLNIFYRFSIKSPEIKPRVDPSTGSDYLVITEDNKELNIYTRWHQYGTIGVLFNVR